MTRKQGMPYGRRIGSSPWAKAGLVAMTEGRIHRVGDSNFGVCCLAKGKDNNRRNCHITPASTPFPREMRQDRWTDWDVRKLCKEGQMKEALHTLDLMEQTGFRASFNTYVCLLHGCMNMKTLKVGKRVHGHILKHGVEPNILLGNALVNMYVKCGSMVD
eukprot:c34131_g1_i1 orf=282-761(+)